uniref:E3 ubiquitin-protein ligase RNF138-like n=1 Tax=Oncorhynchus gorbuscha TaxID=8017 RepID=UPI001EAF62BC|nr:E3 ubiquitin-protein ligase RNF138-like [Oncorhynchus gorbuscha]XP_046177991.1 E3 ubiquitin-protein ligase RNF138-like [Oncorhynchus gorbuscha]
MGSVCSSSLEPVGAMNNIWNAAEGSLDSCSEEDYDCPICQDVLKTPIRTRNCRHVFCKNCFRLAVRAQGPHCPLCRGPVSETEKRAIDVQQQMRERKGQCRACGTTKFLSKMRVHYKCCRKYLEEYGTPLDAPPPPVTPTTQEVSRVSVDTIHMTGILPGQPTQTQISELVRPRVLTLGFLGGRVYSCPYCPLQGLTDMRLVQHCVGSHTGENAPAVCPICAATVWGNASYCSRNLIGHLAIRHYFSYDTYMNVGEDDYTQLCLAIQQSLRQGTGITE